jgi:hypothetical protein
MFEGDEEASERREAAIDAENASRYSRATTKMSD